MNKNKTCAILGASGLIGQQFIRMLYDHPSYQIHSLYTSSNSEGKTVSEVWALPDFQTPFGVKDTTFKNINGLYEIDEFDFDIVFSALPSSVALPIEEYLRSKGMAVFSNSSAYRMDPEVPIMIPEINPDTLELVKNQKIKYNGGFIVTSSNCSVTGAAIYLNELLKIHKIDTAIITTYQALSGAGAKGVSAVQGMGNVIPFINGEEEKIIVEAKKILGSVMDGRIIDKDINIITTCARVSVIDGHLESINARTLEQVDIDVLFKQLRAINSPLEHPHHIAPSKHLIVRSEKDRPQPRIDLYAGSPDWSAKGMAVTVGRIRKQSFDDETWINAFVLVHNTIRGGAGGSILNAEFIENHDML